MTHHHWIFFRAIINYFSSNWSPRFLRFYSPYRYSDFSRGTNWQQILSGKFHLFFHWEFKQENSYPSTSKLVWILSSVSNRTNFGTTSSSFRIQLLENTKSYSFYLPRIVFIWFTWWDISTASMTILGVVSHCNSWYIVSK